MKRQANAIRFGRSPVRAIGFGIVFFSPLAYVLLSSDSQDASVDPLIWEEPRLESPAVLLDGRQEVGFEIPLKNVSRTPAEDLQIGLTCNCSAVEPFPRTVAAGFVGALKGTIRLSKKDQSIRTILRATYQRGKQTFMHHIPVEVQCRPPIAASSHRIELLGTPVQTASISVMQYKLSSPKPFAEVIQTCRGDPINAEWTGVWTELPPVAGFDCRERFLKVTAAAEAGGAEVLIQDSSHGPQASTVVQVQWTSGSDVELSPRAKVLRGDAEKQFTVTASSLSGRSTSIRRVEPPTWLEVVDADRLTRDSSASVTLRLVQPRPTKAVSATIPFTIETDRGVQSRTMTAAFFPKAR